MYFVWRRHFYPFFSSIALWALNPSCSNGGFCCISQFITHGKLWYGTPPIILLYSFHPCTWGSENRWAVGEIRWLLIALWTSGMDFPSELTSLNTDFHNIPLPLWDTDNKWQAHTHTHRPIQTSLQNTKHTVAFIFRGTHVFIYLCWGAFNVNCSR